MMNFWKKFYWTKIFLIDQRIRCNFFRIFLGVFTFYKYGDFEKLKKSSKNSKKITAYSLINSKNFVQQNFFQKFIFK